MSNSYDDLVSMPDGTFRVPAKEISKFEEKYDPHNTITRQTFYTPPDLRVKKTRGAMEKIIAMLREGRTVTSVCDAVGIKYNTLQKWRASDPQFDIACRNAHEARTDQLEDVFYDRVINGVKRESILIDDTGAVQNTRVTVIHDNDLLTKALAARRPEVWGHQTKKVEVTGKDGEPIRVLSVDITTSIEELAKYSHIDLVPEYVAMLEADRKLKEKK